MKCAVGFSILVLVSILVPCQSLLEILEYLENQEKCQIPELVLPRNVKFTNNFIFQRRFLCTMVQHGLMTVKGDFKLDSIKQNLYLGQSNEAEVLIKKCTHKYKTPEETAFFALCCFYRHNMLKKHNKKQ
ncbi:uncharacterized protein LOC123671089 [Harmonia axyridis]|uniref:uncharacterized protein LOC123671089 n=1 Tax=Harmonia axyridis TaxID=115357 RepID=UPI001E27561C|nr:uncharacterized protein LOC123671089 [Harmonia axyridis]